MSEDKEHRQSFCNLSREPTMENSKVSRAKAEKPYKYYSYSSRSNTWTIFFNNKTCLSHDEIKEFFSKYGEVTRVGFKNNLNICFVHFKTEEAAKYCTQDMRHNETIRLRPFTRLADYEKIARKSSPVEIGGISTEFSPNGENSAKPEENASNLHRPKDFCMSDVSLTSAESISMDSKESSKSPDQETFSAANTASETPKNLPNLVRRREAVSYKQKCVQSISRPVRPRWMALRVPAIVPKYIPAEEVIVANIPECCSVDAILQLFRDLYPICTSNMKIAVQSGLRYCHVYFGTLREAKAAETAFDDAKLYDRKIIVLHADTLIENTRRDQTFF